MFCPKCGASLPDGETVCAACAARKRPGVRRIAGCAFFAVIAGYNAYAMGSLLIPEAGREWAFRLSAHPNPANGMHLVAAVLAALLAVACLGGAFVDRTLARPRIATLLASLGIAFVAAVAAWEQDARWPGFAILGVVAVAFLATRPSLRTLPVYVAMLAAAAFGARFVLSTTWHMDPVDAARAFDTEVNKLDMTSTGKVIFAPGLDGGTHMAWVTPDLVRALTQRSVSVNAWFVKDRDCTLPGLGPLAALLALAALAGLCPWLRRRALPPWILAVHLWVALWWSVSQTGFLTAELGFHPPVAVFAAFLALLALACTASIRRGIDRSWDTPAALAWVATAHAPLLAVVAGIYLVTFKSPGSPAFLWMTLYVAVGALAWRASLPPPLPKEAA